MDKSKEVLVTKEDLVEITKKIGDLQNSLSHTVEAIQDTEDVIIQKQGEEIFKHIDKAYSATSRSDDYVLILRDIVFDIINELEIDEKEREELKWGKE